jgi:hypothetical protein
MAATTSRPPKTNEEVGYGGKEEGKGWQEEG